MTVPPDVSDIEYIKVNGELLPLLKCPYCNFRNIHEETIRHHIQCNNQDSHKRVDADKIDKNELYVIKNRKKSRYHYEAKEDYGLPSIKCLWCDYSDKVERDLEYHFLEKHKYRLYKMKASPHERRQNPIWTQDPFSWMYDDIEYRLYKAIRLNKRKTVKQG